MPLPFKSLAPFEGAILLLDYEPMLPVCVPESSGLSESTSADAGNAAETQES